MRFLDYLRYDIKHGFLECYKKMLILCVLVLVSCISTFVFCTRIIPDTTISIMDYLLTLFNGSSPREYTGVYDINGIWLLIQAVIGFVLGSYTTKDLGGFGMQVLIRAKSRTKWWLSKIIWSITMNIIMFLLMYLIVIVWTVVTGGRLDMNFSSEVIDNIEISRILTINCDEMAVKLILFIMPMFISIVVSCSQVLLSLIFNNFIAYIMVQTYVFSSTLFTSWLFISNFAMISKYDCCIPNNVEYGIYMEKGIIVGILVFVSCILIGTFYIENKNILQIGDY